MTTARQPRINELQLLVSFHGISSPGNNCRSYLYERARLEIRCNFLKLISSSFDVPVASQWRGGRGGGGGGGAGGAVAPPAGLKMGAPK